MDKAVIDDIISRMPLPKGASPVEAADDSKEASMLSKVRAKVPEVSPRKPRDPDDDNYLPVGLDGILHASEKLLAVNRELEEPDNRDSLAFKQIMTTDRLMAERIKMDQGRIKASILPVLAKQKSFRNLHPFAFDGYVSGYLLGNPLSTPLEEINPIHLVEQARRVTQMGPGGIGSDNAITEEMQNVSTDQFGFLSTIEGPESLSFDTEVFTRTGWVPAPDITMQHEVACNIEGKLTFKHPEKVHKHHFKGELIGVKSLYVDFLVTPNHRIWYRATDSRCKLGKTWQMGFAQNLYDKPINLAMAHEPRETIGDQFFTHVPGYTLNMVDWCKLLGYWLADGSLCGNQMRISHSDYRPAYNGICDVLSRLKLNWEYRYRKGLKSKNGDFFIKEEGLAKYCEQFGNAGNKYIPEYVQEQSLEARLAMLQALSETDSRNNKTHRSFVTTSKEFACGVERLMISVGKATSFREEPDNRDYVNSTNWIVSDLKNKERQTKTTYNKNAWYKQPYDDFVYCLTTPGGMLFTRRGNGYGHWTGNSEKIGIDTRFAWGTKIGSDGRPYQVVYDRRKKKYRWVNPEDLQNKVIKLPD